MAEERKGAVTMRGNPLTLVGPELKVGQQAPNATLVGKGMKPVTLEEFKGKVSIIAAVPSLDTPVCDAETRRFNEEASKLPGDVQVLTVSMDLPFAQARWCGAAGVDRVTTLSDWRAAEFGEKYGALIKELHLLARTVFVVDKSGKLAYVEYVKEVADQPNF
ncbi:MAG: thiol peroxidase, partial [Candidatus Binataceae bacterium]